MGFLRILLAITVCLHHTAPLGPFHWISGGVSVYVFFVISGFYMAMVLDTRYTVARLGSSWIKNFYLARYFRIFPAYAVAFLTTIVFSFFYSQVHLNLAITMHHHSIKDAIHSILVIISNLTMLALNIPSSHDLVVGPSWSLGVEISFYLIAPFILHKSNRCLIGLVLFGLLLRLIPYNSHLPIFAGIDCFIIGALAYRKRDLLKINLNMQHNTQRIIVFACIFLLLIAGIPQWKLLPTSSEHNTFDYFMYPLIFALSVNVNKNVAVFKKNY